MEEVSLFTLEPLLLSQLGECNNLSWLPLLYNTHLESEREEEEERGGVRDENEAHIS